MFPTSTWVFLSLSIDNALNTQYGFWYMYSSGDEDDKYASRVPSSGSFFSISPTTRIYWGGDTSNKICRCVTQYIRFYIDYAAKSEDEMRNLALMNPQSTLLFTILSELFSSSTDKLYYLHFQSSPTVNSNQTTAVEYFTNTTQGTLTSIKGILIFSFTFLILNSIRKIYG